MRLLGWSARHEFEMFRKLWTFLKSDRVRWFFWWIIQFIILGNYTNAFLQLNKPEIMPAAGAVATVVVWLFYTRKKGQEDDKAREYELKMMRLMVDFDVNSHENINHNLKGDLEKRDYEIALVRRDLEDLKNEFDRTKKDKVTVGVPWSLSGSTIVGRSRTPLPMRGMHQNRHMTSIDSYKGNIARYRDAIIDHRKRASRFGLLEGVAICYTAALSAFGSDIVRWFNS